MVNRDLKVGCLLAAPSRQATTPLSPGGAQVWTTFNYDGLGRTVSQVAWCGAAKTCLYVANTVILNRLISSVSNQGWTPHHLSIVFLKGGFPSFEAGTALTPAVGLADF